MGRDRQLYELSKSNPVLNIRWKDRINQITNHFTKDSFPCLLYKPINNFYINVKKYYFTSFILNQGQPGLAIMAKKKKKHFNSIFYQSMTHWFLFYSRFHGCDWHVIDCLTMSSHTEFCDVCMILSVYLR